MGQLLAILETAIKREVEACKLYRRGEETATTPEAKALFRRLAAEETKHKELLVELYQQVAGRAVYEEWLL